MIINGKETTSKDIAGLIDLAVLDPDADKERILQSCREGVELGVKGVHANLVWAELVADALQGTKIETGLPIAFPFGTLNREIKAAEAKYYLQKMAGRPCCVDMVTNIGRLKSGDWREYTREIADVVEIGHDYGVEVKAILEVALLTEEEIALASRCAADAGADFVKTSTGRNGNPSITAVRIMRRNIPDHMGVKFSGYGSYNPAELTLMALAAGATRLGTRRAKTILEQLDREYSGLEFNIQ